MTFSRLQKILSVGLALALVLPSPAQALRISQPAQRLSGLEESLSGLEEDKRPPMGVLLQRARLKSGGILIVPSPEGPTVPPSHYRILEVARGRIVAGKLGFPAEQSAEFTRSQLPKKTRYIDPPEAQIDIPRHTARFVIPGDWTVLIIGEWLKDWIAPDLDELPIDKVAQLTYPLSEMIGNVNEHAYRWNRKSQTVIELDWHADRVRAVVKDQQGVEFRYGVWLDSIPVLPLQPTEYFRWKANQDQERRIAGKRESGGMAGTTLSISRQANEFIIDSESFEQGVGNTSVLLFPKPSAFEEPPRTGLEELLAMRADRGDYPAIIQGEFAVVSPASNPVVKTWGVWSCIACALYDRRTKVGLLAHMDGWNVKHSNSYELMVAALQRAGLTDFSQVQVRLAGWREGALKDPMVRDSIQMVRRIIAGFNEKLTARGLPVLRDEQITIDLKPFNKRPLPGVGPPLARRLGVDSGTGMFGFDALKDGAGVQAALRRYEDPTDRPLREVNLSAGLEEAPIENFLQLILPAAGLPQAPMVITGGLEEQFPALRNLSRLPGVYFQEIGEAPSDVVARLIAETPTLSAVRVAGLEEEMPGWRPVAQMAQLDLQEIASRQDLEKMVFAILSAFSGLEEEVLQTRTGFQEFMAGLKERRSAA